MMRREKEKGTKTYRKRWKELYQDADTWRQHWKELAEYLYPRRGVFLTNEDEESGTGDKKGQKIINTRSIRARKIAAAGLMSNSSPSRPWFRFALPDDDLMEYQPVKEWLHEVRSRVMTVYQRSNFYGAAYSLYSEMVSFGWNPMLIEEDPDTIIRCKPMTIGEAYIGCDKHLRPNSLYRCFWMTAYQLLDMFGEDNLTSDVKAALRNKTGDKKFKVYHVIEPRNLRDPAILNPRNMPYASVYYLDKATNEEFLRISGYRTIPFVAPRWDVVGTDIYGDCPGIDALADVKMLQKMEKDKLMGLDKEVNPPMNAPTSMKKTGGTIISGGVNYIDVTQGQQGFTPAYQVRPDIRNLAIEIDRVEQRINEHFHVDLFIAVLNENKQMTATEVAQRHAEKLQQLGPVLERLQSEFLGPAIDRTVDIMESMGLLPEPPQEIQGMDLDIQYISLLAQAQKMVGTTGIEQLAGFGANLAGVNPDVLDKFDFDEMVDQYAEMLGVPPELVRADDAVAELRQARAQQMAQQQAMEQGMNMAQGAKLLSDAKLEGDSALDQLVGGI